MQETEEMKVWSLNKEDPLEEEMATHSMILAGKKSRAQRSPAGYNPQGHIEMDMTEHMRADFSLFKRENSGG